MNRPCTYFGRAGILVVAAAWWVPNPGDFVSAAPHMEPIRHTTNSPLRAAVQRGTGRIGLRLDLDDVTYRELRTLDRTRLTGFPLEPDRRIDLNVTRFEVFAPDARIVLGTRGGDVPVGRPDVVFLKGYVIGSPDSSVVLSLSPHGANGLIHIEGRLFVVATPPAHHAAGTVIYDWALVPPGAINWHPWRCGTDKLHTQGRQGHPGLG